MSNGHHIVNIDTSSSFQFDDIALIQWLSSNHHKRHCLLGSITTINITSQSSGKMSNIHLLENQSPVESSATMMNVADDNGYASVKILDTEWNIRLQDKGCTKAMLPNTHYRRSQIPPIGPEGAQTYYFQLTSIAIDILLHMKVEKDLGRGWSKVPNNRTDGKVELIQVIFLTKKSQNSEFYLDQTSVLDMCLTMWGAAHPVNIIHRNDRVRVFGIIMTVPENRDIFGQLANGPTGHTQIDDISYHPKQIYQSIALAFNNESVNIELPFDAYDLSSIKDINPNDMGRICITRDCK